MSTREIIYEGPKGVRVDKFLAQTLGLSRNYLRRLLQSGFCIVEGKVVEPDYRLMPGMTLCLQEKGFSFLEEKLVPAKGKLDILYLDEAVVVVNKPAGLLTHPVDYANGDTLVNRLVGYTSLAEIGRPWRPGIVHRLDRETSGLLVVARSNQAYWNLINQFKAHVVEKHYLAVVSGVFPSGETTLEINLAPRKADRTTMQVYYLSGKVCVTRVRLLRRFRETSLVRATPVTGRTHQIRLTLKHHGFPVLGDRKYGVESKFINRVALHHFRLSFFHPVTGKKMTFSAPLPEDFLRLLTVLGEGKENDWQQLLTV